MRSSSRRQSPESSSTTLCICDDAGALADQALTHAVHRLQIELLSRPGGDEFHRRAQHHPVDCSCVAKVVPRLRIGPQHFAAALYLHTT
jgi:hypothetical protein